MYFHYYCVNLNHMRIILTAVFISLFSFTALAQSSLRPGWVVLNNGDTLHGKIQERDWNENPSRISFFSPSEKTYTVTDLRAFGLDNNVTYARYSITRHLVPYSEDLPLPESLESTEKSTVWLRIILRSRISLGALFLKERPWFFALQPNGEAEELMASKGQQSFADDKYKYDIRYGKVLLVETDEYKTQLRNLFPETSGFLDNARVSYTERSLESVFRRLNTLENVSTKKRISLGISAGAGFYNNKVSGEYPSVLSYSTFKSATGPLVRLSLNITNPAKRSRVLLVPEIGFSSFSTTGSKQTQTSSGSFDLHSVMAEGALLTRIYLNPFSPAKVYLSAGLNVAGRIGGENQYNDFGSSGTTVQFVEKGVPKQNGFMISPLAGAGLQLKQFGVFVNYYHFGNITNYVSSFWKLTRIAAGISFDLKR